MYEIKNSKTLRPREKLKLFGIHSLNTAELLALILQTGTKGKNVMEVAKELSAILKKQESPLTLRQLEQIMGVGFIKATKLLAAFELGKRVRKNLKQVIKEPVDVYKLAWNIVHRKQEHFMMITLNGASCLIRKRILFIGTANRSIVHPREIFLHAIRDSASSIVLVHNHPSGNTQPSEEDVIVTQKLKMAGELLGINVLEHLIVGKHDYFSFHQNRLL